MFDRRYGLADGNGVDHCDICAWAPYDAAGLCRAAAVWDGAGPLGPGNSRSFGVHERSQGPRYRRASVHRGAMAWAGEQLH